MRRVLGIGDNVVDKYVHLGMMFPGGNALNFAAFAKLSGVEAAYLGVFGNDASATHIRQVLEELNVDTSRCRIHPGENGYARVSLVDGDRVFLPGNKGGVSSRFPIRLDATDLAYIKGFDLLHSSCYSFLESEIPILRQTGIPFSFDFSDEIDDAYLQRICPSVDFAFLSCGHLTEDQTREKLADCLSYGCGYALGSRGAEGAWLYDGRAYFHQPAKTVRAVDTLGAGDSFITAFLLHLLPHMKLNGALQPIQASVLAEGLEKGSEAAVKTCLVQGAFGHGIAYEEIEER